jgi:hypothetical protein
VTQLRNMAVPTREAAHLLDPQTLREAMERYLANPIFRAAQYQELVLDDNPYRRPVRPDDIGLVDFSAPLDRRNFSQLSGLMGHRMLLNIYDTRKLLMPSAPTQEKWRDFARFYGEANRVLGDVIRPYLEDHLFAFVRDEAAERTTDDPKVIRGRIGEFTAARRAQADALRSLVAASPSRDNMVSMVAIQSVAIALNARLSPPVELPVPGRALGLPGHPGHLDDLAREVAGRTGVKYEPHSYFQYYLPSTLALMNYLNAAAQDPGRAFRLAGALAAHMVDTAIMSETYPDLMAGDPPALPVPAGRGPDTAALDEVVAAVDRIGGPFGAAEMSRGFEEYAVLLDVQHQDCVTQFSWIDQMPAYRAKAESLQKAIDEYEIPVELDTFVESWEECSTTHVHDEDRLLVIESGEMEFWNCFGTQHTYVPGDKTFIPKHRLHGSVVLSGECVYHQPVITPELDARFG